MNDDIANHDSPVCWERPRLGVPELYEPRRDGGRREDRYMTGEAIERPKGKVVCVRVSYEDPAERR